MRVGHAEPGAAVSHSSTCRTSGLRRLMSRLKAKVSNGLTTSTPPNDSRLTLATSDLARATIWIAGLSRRAPIAIAWLTASSPASAISPWQCGLRMPPSSSTSARRASAVSVERRRRVVLDGDPGDALRLRLDDDQAVAQPVERARQPGAALSVAAQHVERLGDAAHAPDEHAPREQRAKRRIVDERDHRAQRVGPADHRQVDREGHPQPLRVVERMRNLAEADGRRGVAHHVERVEDAHPARIAVGVDAGNQRQPADRDRVDGDQRDQRRAQAPQDQEEHVAHGGGCPRGARPSVPGAASRRAAGSPRTGWRAARRRTARRSRR